MSDEVEQRRGRGRRGGREMDYKKRIFKKMQERREEKRQRKVVNEMMG